jgi:hypothetical protein
MEQVGLLPTATGEPGGKQTGHKVTHVIAEDGCFAHLATTLQATYPAILYQDRGNEQHEKDRKTKTASKTKYSCSRCGLNAWAKPKSAFLCGTCLKPMEADVQAGEQDTREDEEQR